MNELIMQKNIAKRPESKNVYIENHRILQEVKFSKKYEENQMKIKEQSLNKNSLSPSKLKKTNAFEIVPVEIFEEELENFLKESNNLYRDLFVSTCQEILKIRQNFCETNILEVHNRSNQKEGFAILYVNKVTIKLTKNLV